MSGIFEKFKEALWSGTYPINSSTIIAYLVKMSSITSAHFRSVAGCTAATLPIASTSSSWAKRPFIFQLPTTSLRLPIE